jgi:hypothetical protein
MQVQQKLVNNMLKNIKDDKLRETYGQIIQGNYPYSVYCMDPQNKMHKPGLLIGYIRKDGRTVEEETLDERKTSPTHGLKIAGLITSRDRFDGRKGFRCECGNSSILAEQEQGIIGQGQPTQADLYQVAENLQRKPTLEVPFINGAREYEGFKVEANK